MGQFKVNLQKSLQHVRLWTTFSNHSSSSYKHNKNKKTAAATAGIETAQQKLLQAQ